VGLWRGEEPSQFIFDLMELERPNIDRAVLEFVKGHVFDPADFWNSQRRRLSA
jgi:CRISPR/Cas system-associated endonuclease Cas1